VARPGDLVLVDGHFIYWSLLWYYAGPEWGRPQQAFVLNRNWAGLTQRHPAFWERLGFGAADGKLERQGVTILMWDRDQSPPSSAGRTFVVRPLDTAPVALPGRHLDQRMQLYPLLVERWAP
jgi:hypothetical protein